MTIVGMGFGALEAVVYAIGASIPVPVDIGEQTRVFFEFYGSQPQWVERLLCEESYAGYAERLHQKNTEKNRARFERLHPTKTVFENAAGRAGKCDSCLERRKEGKDPSEPADSVKGGRHP